MLLQSDRHTERDLEYWHSLRKEDRIYGELLTRSGKPERAIERIRQFADLPCYASTSWGKDSTVMCHLLALSGVRVPVVHIVQEGPQKDPEQHRVRDAFLGRFDLDYHEIVVEHDGSREHRDDGFARFPALEIGIRRARKRFGDRYISGLRAEESGLRKHALRKTFREAARSCWPIGRWTTKDVYGWAERHDLPLHPAYGCTRGGFWDREQIRVGIIGGPKGTQYGRAQWEWEYYPEVMRVLDPELTT